MDDGAPELASLVRMVADRALKPREHRRPICLFLGAGADISSGGLTFSELKRDAISRFAGRPVSDVTTDATLDVEFETLFSRLPADERALLVEAAFRRFGELEPSESYKLLVLLVEAQGVDAIVTTNFDTMLEAAQAALGRDLFQVYAAGLARPYARMDERYASLKRPYVKLHGDLGSRTVTALVRAELHSDAYDPDTIELVRSTLASHDLIIAGYGGWDGGLAGILARGVEGAPTRVFWCGPRAPDPTAPLAVALAGRFRHVAVDFDAMMAAVARPVLEKPSLAATEPGFVASLFQWRVDYANRSFSEVHATRSRRDISESFARRPALEEALGRFLEPNRPLCLVTGPSGFGKTTLGLRLLRSWSTRPSTRLLLLPATGFPEGGDIERHVGDLLGGLGARSPFSLHRFERWLIAEGLQLVIFVDGVNEVSDDLSLCVSFLRGILRFCYFLPEHGSAIRIVATIRQESWTAMLPRLDLSHLRHAAWSPGTPDEGFETLACDAFSDEELLDAVERMGSAALGVDDLAAMTTASSDRLKDPYLLRIVAEGPRRGFAAPSGSQVRATIEAKLVKTASTVAPAHFQRAVAKVAMVALEAGRHTFRATDFGPADARGEILRLARDLDVVRDAGQGLLWFDHDRTFEYFLAVAIGDAFGPRLETLSDLRHYVDAFQGNGRALAGARLHLELNPAIGLPLISEALRATALPGSLASNLGRRVHDFAREVLVQLARAGERHVGTYLADAIESARLGAIGEVHLRAAVQAAAALPASDAVRLLGRVLHPSSDLPRIEAQIYAVDRLAIAAMARAPAVVDLLAEAPFADYLADPSLASWQRAGRLASLAMQIGPDNSHPDEYAPFAAAALAAMRSPTAAVDPRSAPDFAGFFLANCDRLLFNATEEGVRRFFAEADRTPFAEILAKVRAGAAMTLADYDRLAPYARSIDYDVEYHLSAALLVLSSLNDVEGALAVAEAAFGRLDDAAEAVEVDFLEEILVYVHVLHGLDYDEARFAPWEETILESWPTVLMHRPGIERGGRRGFVDDFDRIFEDGFGVVYAYGTLSPSRRRRSMLRDDYIKTASAQGVPALPLYSRWLERYLREGRIDEALQLVQGIAGIVVSWPFEGLSALRPAIGHPDGSMSRAVDRVLAEAWNRHPGETSRFLRVSGVALGDDKLLEITVRRDARLGRRQVAEEEYARLLHLLLRLEGGRDVAFGCIEDLLAASTFEDAVAAIFARIAAAC